MMVRGKVRIVLATVCVLGAAFAIAYLSGGDSKPPAPEERFAEMTGFEIPESLGALALKSVESDHPYLIEARYQGATLTAERCEAGPSRYVFQWDPDAMLAAAAETPPPGSVSGTRDSVIDLRGGRALVEEAKPLSAGGVTLTWATGNVRVTLSLPFATLDEAIAIAEAL